MRLVRWQIEPDAVAALLRELAFGYYKWDVTVGGETRVLPFSLVLSAEEHSVLVSATERFARALRRAEARAQRDRALLDALGVPARVLPLVERDAARGPSFGRGDFFLTPEGRWQVSEFNEDVPGGFNESVGVPSLLDESTAGGRFVGDLRGALVAAWDRCHRVGFVHASCFSEDLQHCAVYAKWLREAGHETVLASPDTVRWRWRRPEASGMPVDGLFRFYPGEWMVQIRDLRAWGRAVERTPVMNPFRALATQSKAAFAHWDELVGAAEPDEPGEPGALELRTFLPHTEAFEPARAEQYEAERGAWVLKRAFGRMGDAVVLGALETESDWARAVRHAASGAERWVAQRRFDVQPLEVDGDTWYPTVGAYAVNGRFAGYYSRVARRPFITHEAFHVATVVEVPRGAGAPVAS